MLMGLVSIKSLTHLLSLRSTDVNETNLGSLRGLSFGFWMLSTCISQRSPSIGSPSHLWMRALPALWSLAIDSNGLFIRALMKHPINLINNNNNAPT